MAKLKQELSRRNPENLVALAKLVHPKVAPVAPGVPPVANVTTEAAALLAASNAADAANIAWDAAKTTQEALLVTRRAKADLLRQAHAVLGSILEAKSMGDAAALAATGYDLAGSTTPATTPPDKIVNLVVTAGDNDGSVDASCDPEPKSSSYEWQVTSVNPVAGPYETKDTTTSSNTNLAGYESGIRIWVRVRGIGAKGPGPWSDPGTKIVP